MAAPYLQKRRSGWYLRLRVPSDLVPRLGSHLTRSLKTRDYQLARQLAVQAAAQYGREWGEMRSGMDIPGLPKPIEEMSGEELREMGTERLIAVFRAAAPHQQMAIALRWQEILDYMRDRVEAEEDWLLQAKDAHLELLRNKIREKDSLIEGMKLAVSHLPIAVGAAPPAIATVQSLQSPSPARQSSDDRPAPEPWTEYEERFFKDRPSIGEGAKVSYRQAFRILREVIGEKLIDAVTKTDIKAFADHLRDRPTNRTGRTGLSRDTIVKLLSHAKTFFDWAVGAGIIETDPAKDVTPRSKTRAERDNEGGRDAFSNEQLVSLFNSPLFTGCHSEERVSMPGSYLCRDERYWFFLAAHLTGARVAELAGAPAKLAMIADIPCLDLREAGTKTNNSPRLIPILPELQKLGFMEWAEGKEREGEGKLFQGGRAVEDWSKFTNRYLDQIKVSGPKHVFYSLRHNFRQMLNTAGGAGLSLETADKIFGHGKTAKNSVGAGYGRSLSEGEARLFVNSVKAPVSLVHLYPAKISRRYEPV